MYRYYIAIVKLLQRKPFLHIITNVQSNPINVLGRLDVDILVSVVDLSTHADVSNSPICGDIRTTRGNEMPWGMTHLIRCRKLHTFGRYVYIVAAGTTPPSLLSMVEVEVYGTTFNYTPGIVVNWGCYKAHMCLLAVYLF